jgi:hypothetical protein
VRKLKERVSVRKLASVAAVVALSLSLSACFDLTQKVAIGRDGAGRYEIAITAQGLLGEALKDKRDTVVDLKHNHARTRTVESNGRVTQTATIDFKSLSELHLSDEALSLTNHGASFFGLGPSHLTFRRTFLVDRAKRENSRRNDDEGMGTALAQSIFGDHSYVFSVTVPGSIERIAPVRIGRTTIRPTVTGDAYNGHTVTWRMPLYAMLQSKMLIFEVDFSAYGWFPDAQSVPEGSL